MGDARKFPELSFVTAKQSADMPEAAGVPETNTNKPGQIWTCIASIKFVLGQLQNQPWLILLVLSFLFFVH